MKKGQASIEYLIIITAVIIVILVITFDFILILPVLAYLAIFAAIDIIPYLIINKIITVWGTQDNFTDYIKEFLSSRIYMSELYDDEKWHTLHL